MTLFTILNENLCFNYCKFFARVYWYNLGAFEQKMFISFMAYKLQLRSKQQRL